jgi:hypothetical protein
MTIDRLDRCMTLLLASQSGMTGSCARLALAAMSGKNEEMIINPAKKFGIGQIL